jgi:hydroxymethylpyrimidine pyrophosphatase-like HAD family hydrolase
MRHMKWQALATDFDGTIATDGVVDEPTKDALVRLQSSKIKTILVTGRELTEFRTLGVFLQMFDMIVAENGAVLYNPFTEEIKALGAPPPETFIEELSKQGVPLSVGTSIVATVEPHEVVVLETIKNLGLELQVIFNKGAVMILPSGVNKASGLLAALKECGIDPANVVGVGDAENDHAFLELCGLPVAVANALPSLKEKAALVTEHSAGAGVVELIYAILRGDLENRPSVEATAQ